jgi:polar amino acid transport system ATP-binding protein
VFAREVASKVCFLYEGRVHEEGPPKQIFDAPQNERTRAFLQRIIESGPAIAPLAAVPG